MASLLLVFIYLSFVSLGLPDSVLGSAWPSIYPSFGVPISYAGGISLIISAGTVCSSLLSERLTRRLGTGPLTTLSVGMTATALFGFSVSRAYWQLCLWAIPYGLGAGSVDAALNHYVALHYKSRHMSWLHGLWGVGAVAGPTVMGFVLTAGGSWTQGYRYISFFQMALTAVLLCSLPLWKKAHPTAPAVGKPEKPRTHTLRQTVRIPGAKSRVPLLRRAGADGRALGKQLPRPAGRDVRGYGGEVRRAVLPRHYRRTVRERVSDLSA